jgi:hypothetical protein
MAVLAMAMALGCSGDKDKKDSPPPDKKATPGDKKAIPEGSGDKKTPDLPGDGEDNLKTRPADFVLTSKDFATQYEKDSEAAGKKYKGKVIELTGVVWRVGYLAESDYLGLAGSGSRGNDVSCLTRERVPWRKALPGQTVTIRGTGIEPPFTGAPTVLFKCDIVAVSGEPPPVLTADQLSEKFAANPEETLRTVEGKPVVVTGVVEKVGDNPSGFRVTLKTKAKGPAVVCIFDFHQDENIPPELKPGRPLKCVGHYNRIEERTVVLWGCAVIELGK